MELVDISIPVPIRSYLLLARFTIRRELLVAKFAAEIHPHGG